MIQRRNTHKAVLLTGIALVILITTSLDQALAFESILVAKLSSPVCGNSVLDPGEQCDDGNELIDDGCSSSCQIEDGWQCTAPTSPGYISDPSFEAGTPNPYWAEFSTKYPGIICSLGICTKAGGSGPLHGSSWVYFGMDRYEEGYVSQSVVIPSTVTDLAFHLEVPRCDSASDYFEVLIDNTQELLIDGSSPLCGIFGYSTQSVDITTYADGGTHDLMFHSKSLSVNGGVSRFFLDLIAMPGSPSICTPGMAFQINAGHAGAWFNPETPGQGQLVDVEPASKFLFLSWFTFTDAASEHPNEQHWFTAQGNYSGDTADLLVYETLGGQFDDPQEVSTDSVGTATLSFADCGNGQLDYTIDSWELQGSFPLQRAIAGTENVCQERAGLSAEPLEPNDGLDGAWYDAASPGQGFLIDAHPGNDFIFVAWFTYGDDTASGQRWLTAQGPLAGSTADLVVYETLGGSFDDPDPSVKPIQWVR